MRALVDYAHARGVRVILFYSAVYAHDGSQKGEWLALPGLQRAHPDWFISLTPPWSGGGRYLLDYGHTEARDYLAGVLRRYVGEYGADGVKLDGLGDVEGHLIPFGERATHLPRRWALTPVLDVYRLVAESLRAVKPDAFVESGWVNPAAAHPYAHTFRYGDEWNVFTREYPFPGLAEHFRYAAIQRGLLGQRPHVGAVFGGLNNPVADQWLGAALALGAQVSLGSDLTFLSPEGLAGLRALLVHHRPFAGETRTGPEGFGLRPSWAATTVGDLTFLALVNEAQTAQRMQVGLAEAVPAWGPNDVALSYDPASGQASRVRDTLAAEVPAQSLRLIVLRRTPGVVWTTSSFEQTALPGGWRVLVRGPAAVGGELKFHQPGGPPRSVLLDGRPLPLLDPNRPAGAEGYTYDGADGVLTLVYTHAGLPAPASGTPLPVRTLEIVR
jgi:hypothetical protein